MMEKIIEYPGVALTFETAFIQFAGIELTVSTALLRYEGFEVERCEDGGITLFVN